VWRTFNALAPLLPQILLGLEIGSSLKLHPTKASREKTPQKTTLNRHPPSPSTSQGRSILIITVAKMADADTPVTLRTRKFIRNPLLGRKQMVV
jgi:hypothetical protein